MTSDLPPRADGCAPAEPEDCVAAELEDCVPAGGDVRSAIRLLRWYPAGWRARYGAEFTELLLAELAERPRSWRRTADVIRGGLQARLTCAGLTSHVRAPSDQIRSGQAWRRSAAR